MPRPGPRPYECVRRAWHSDRHQPMRGSIIQQIFRVVYQSHKPGTKKNREWQEKLPCVVLKAEEIIYSKANSEAEYMDLETLWDRVSDAINTIIRRDESTETGELLPPCVEAALNLGCVPVRASRSQRHNNPRSYLSPRTQDPASQAHKNLDTATSEPNTSLFSPKKSTFDRPTQINLNHSIPESNRHTATQKNKNIPSHSNSFPSPKSNASINVGRVYPLYTGTNFQLESNRLGSQPQTSPTPIIVGRPVFPLITGPTQMGSLSNIFSRDWGENASNRISEAHLRDNEEKVPDVETCDLSLKLGLYSKPCSSNATAGICSSNLQEGERVTDSHLSQTKEFSFFPMESASRWNFTGEGSNEEVAIRKRKGLSNQSLEDGQMELYSNPFAGRIRRY